MTPLQLSLHVEAIINEVDDTIRKMQKANMRDVRNHGYLRSFADNLLDQLNNHLAEVEIENDIAVETSIRNWECKREEKDV